MAKAKADLKALIKKFGLKQNDVWDCHGTLVMLHRTCESVAQQLGIKFDNPQVLLAEGESVAILVTGHLEGESAWSIGEASPKNNKNAYPWAMAEKRAKDRVILKLARFNEVGVYSDIEADDFKKPAKVGSHQGGKASPELNQTLDAMRDTANDMLVDGAKSALATAFGGDKDAALDWLHGHNLPVPDKCDRDQLNSIINMLEG